MSEKAQQRDARQQRNSALRWAGGALLAALVMLVVALALEQGAVVGARPEGADRTSKLDASMRAAMGSSVSAQIAAAAADVGAGSNSVPTASMPVPEPEASAPSLVTGSMPSANGPEAPGPGAGEAPAGAAGWQPRANELDGVMAEAKPAPADGYRIQLGVFADPANAVALARDLNGRGLPAGIQSRVVLGPFADRDAAHKAQVALRAAGVETGMLLPPAKKKR